MLSYKLVSLLVVKLLNQFKNNFMKRILLSACILIAGLNAVQAQSMGKGKNVLYLGAGIGSGYVGSDYGSNGAGYTIRRSPDFQLGFEHGISEAIPQSIIGIGPHFSTSFASNEYRDIYGRGWDKHWANYDIAAKGFYHHKFLVGERWDVYGSVSLGVRFQTYSFTATNANYSYAEGSNNAIAPIIGVGVGGRFYVTKVFGFYAEVGGGLNAEYAQIGIAFKF